MEEHHQGRHHEAHGHGEHTEGAHHSHTPGSAASKKAKLDYWKAAVAILAVLFIVSITTDWLDFSKGVSQDEATAKALEFVNQNLLQGQTAAQVQTVTEQGGLYIMELSVAGQSVTTYVSKDGSFFFPQGINMNEPLPEAAAPPPPSQPVQPLPKTDKPKIELFVMSHCPYGTQAEKGILPVVEALGDNVDFDLKFVYYAMHGKKEVDEQMRQVCIENEQPQRFRTYLACFLEDGDSERCLTANNVDKVKLAGCVTKLDQTHKVTESFNDQSTWLSGQFPLFNVDKADNVKYSVGGSPTLIINGVEASSGRSPAEYLTTVCSSFTTPPDACGGTLSTTTFSAGFGYDVAAAGVQASCGP